MMDVAGHGKQLPSSEREQQLRLELQQLNHQINQQTQLRGLEVCTPVYLLRWVQLTSVLQINYADMCLHWSRDFKMS